MNFRLKIQINNIQAHTAGVKSTVNKWVEYILYYSCKNHTKH